MKSLAAAAPARQRLTKNRSNTVISDSMPKLSLIDQARTYWDRCRGARTMPSRGDLDLAEMVPFLPYVVLVDVLRDPLDFRYRVIGTEIENHSAGRHTGKQVSEIPERAPPSAVWDNMLSVAESGQPSDRSVPYVGPLKDFTSTRQITLPLSDNAKVVDKLLLVIEYYRDLPKRAQPETPEDARRAAGNSRLVSPTDNPEGGGHCEAR